MIESVIKIGLIFIIGFVAGALLIMCDKTTRYDLNNDGKIDLTDIVLLRNYILEKD